MRSEALELVTVKERSLVWFLLATFLPTVFTFMWIQQNTQLPVSDPANFLSTAVDIYHHYLDQGIWDGIKSCYLVRGWRPIFFPVLIFPFLILTHGNLLISCSLISLFGIILTSIYSYLFFRIDLDRWQAIVAANFIGLLPMIQVQVLGIYAEGILFPCIIGSIYHLIQSNYLRNFKHSLAFSLLFGLAIILRPIETSMLMVFVICFFIGLGYKQRVYSLQQITMLISVCLTSLFIFISAIHLAVLKLDNTNQLNFGELHLIKFIFRSVSLVTILFGSLTAVLQFFPGNKNKIVPRSFLIMSFSLAFFITLVWLVPFALETFLWIYQTSLGDVAAGTTRITGSQFQIWGEFNIQSQAEGRLAVFGSIALASLSLLILLSKRKSFPLVSISTVYLLLIIPLPWAEILFTVQDINRKLSVAFPALIMALLIISLRGKEKLLFRTVLVGLVFIGHFIIFYLATFGDIPLNPILNNTVGYYLRPPVLIKPNPHDVVRDFLTVQAKQHQLNSIAIEVNPYTMDPVDPFLMATVVQAANKNYGVNYAYIDTFSPKNPQIFLNRTQAIFLSDNVHRMKISPEAAQEYAGRLEKEKNPSVKTLYEFLYYYSTNQLASIGWKLGSCVIIKSSCLIYPVESGIRKDDCLGCLLLPIK